jgi:hypothetical protein
MMLRESITQNGENINFEGITDPACTRINGVPNSELLIRFADALIVGSDSELDAARAAVTETMGAATMVDVAAVGASFQRMVRVADATGIPLDEPEQVMTEDLREKLGLNEYVAAANTRQMPLIKRLFWKLVGARGYRRAIKRSSGSGKNHP